MYFLTALVCTIISAVFWFIFRNNKLLHFEILTITFGASTLMWLIDCIAGAIEEGVFLDFEDPAGIWISLATVIGGTLLWAVAVVVINLKAKKKEA